MEHHVISPSLAGKLAAIVKYVDDRRLGRRGNDQMGLDTLLDDREVADWLTSMGRDGRIRPSFIGRDNGGW